MSNIVFIILYIINKKCIYLALPITKLKKPRKNRHAWVAYAI